jgi:hypothetical protein
MHFTLKISTDLFGSLEITLSAQLSFENLRIRDQGRAEQRSTVHQHIEHKFTMTRCTPGFFCGEQGLLEPASNITELFFL